MESHRFHCLPWSQSCGGLHNRENGLWKAWRIRRWVFGNVYVDNTFFYHQRNALLSMWYSVVHLCMSKQLTIHALWITLPASSRSLLLTWPYGLSKETRCAVISAGNAPAIWWGELLRVQGVWPQHYAIVGEYGSPLWVPRGYRTYTHILWVIVVAIHSTLEQYELIQYCRVFT